jgi:glyceraldehyde 3-phosphate dehydrogenase
MRDHEQRHVVLGAGVFEEVDHLLLVGRVDAGGRLVGEDHPRPVGERPGHRHPLLLADREFGWLVMQSIGEPHGREEVGGPRPVGLARAKRHRHQHVFEGRESRQQVELLKHEPELIGPHPVATGLGEPHQIDTVDHDAARIGPHDPGDHVQQRRLARPALPLEGALLAGSHRKRLDVEDGHRLPAGEGESLPHMFELDDGCGHDPFKIVETAEFRRPIEWPARPDVYSDALRGPAARCVAALSGSRPSRPRSFAVSIRVGINGFGRIGRLTFRAIYEKYGLNGDVQVVALNDLTDAKTNAHLLEFDSNYGPFKGQVSYDGNDIVVDGKKIKVFAERDPGAIPWGTEDVQIVVESTGFFTDATKAVAHKRDSVKKVVISAPAKNEDLTIVLGVNDTMYDAKKHHVISNASCTTNGLAPVAKVLHEAYGIDRGLLTTVHAYTNSQKTVDTAAKDLRDARAAALNIVPSSTGAAKAVGLVIPELQGKFTGMAFRVPTPTVSVVDFTALLNKDAAPADINAVMKKAAEGPLKGILRYTEKELVSTDLKGDPHSSIFSAVDTIGLGNFVKVVSWYDNEWGYSNRVADLLNFLEDRGL